jgi:hypothetical protein
MESGVLIFFAGVVVGMLAVAIVLGLRRVRAGSETTLPGGITGPAPIASAGSSRPGGPGILGTSGAKVRTTVTTRVSRTQIRLDGGAPHVLVEGQTYHNLADLPETTRNLIVDELRVALPQVPETARGKLEALIASAGDGPPPGESPGTAAAPALPEPPSAGNS